MELCTKTVIATINLQSHHEGNLASFMAAAWLTVQIVCSPLYYHSLETSPMLKKYTKVLPVGLEPLNLYELSKLTRSDFSIDQCFMNFSLWLFLGKEPEKKKVGVEYKVIKMGSFLIK